MSKEQFRKLCKIAWDQPYGFVVIDLASGKNNGKYRCGFDQFYFPDLSSTNKRKHKKVRHSLRRNIHVNL